MHHTDTAIHTLPRRQAALLVCAACAHLLWASTAHGADEATPATSGAITVKVIGLRGSKGKVQCGLWNAERGFPDEQQLRRRSVPIVGGAATCSFEDVPSGTYAVALFHDENENGKLDRGLFGKPMEGYGVSNNKTYALAGPNFRESKFVFNAEAPKLLDVSLRY